MRHGKKIHKIGRGASHRKATLSSMAIALIQAKHIKTTLAKARALRPYIEPLITRAKEDTTHNRRTVFSVLGKKEAVDTLFSEIGPKVQERPGGYTRILKLGPRQGDGAEMALIELVDYNEFLPSTLGKKKVSRRSRRGKKKGGAETTVEAPKQETVAIEATPEVTEEAPVTETAETETPIAEAIETPVEETSEAPASEIAEEESPKEDTTQPEA